jgi:hypothetical protein
MPLVAIYVSSSSQAKSKASNPSSTRPVGSIIEALGAAPEAPEAPRRASPSATRRHSHLHRPLEDHAGRVAGRRLDAQGLVHWGSGRASVDPPGLSQTKGRPQKGRPTPPSSAPGRPPPRSHLYGRDSQPQGRLPRPK